MLMICDKTYYVMSHTREKDGIVVKTFEIYQWPQVLKICNDGHPNRNGVKGKMYMPKGKFCREFVEKYVFRKNKKIKDIDDICLRKSDVRRKIS